MKLVIVCFVRLCLIDGLNIYRASKSKAPDTCTDEERRTFEVINFTIIYFAVLKYLYLAATDMGCDAANVASDE